MTWSFDNIPDPLATCGYRFDHDPVTLVPRGDACGRPATKEIHWNTGHLPSLGCDHHAAELRESCPELIVKIVPFP